MDVFWQKFCPLEQFLVSLSIGEFPISTSDPPSIFAPASFPSPLLYLSSRLYLQSTPLFQLPPLFPSPSCILVPASISNPLLYFSSHCYFKSSPTISVPASICNAFLNLKLPPLCSIPAFLKPTSPSQITAFTSNLRFYAMSFDVNVDFLAEFHLLTGVAMIECKYRRGIPISPSKQKPIYYNTLKKSAREI